LVSYIPAKDGKVAHFFYSVLTALRRWEGKEAIPRTRRQAEHTGSKSEQREYCRQTERRETDRPQIVEIQ
jgi:hypothetical protein